MGASHHEESQFIVYSCDEGQEAHLEDLAKQLDGYVHHLKGSFGDIGDQRLVVMAGIMVMDERVEFSKKLKKLEAELAELRDSSLLQNREKQEGDEELAQSINDVATKIEALSRKIANGAA